MEMTPNLIIIHEQLMRAIRRRRRSRLRNPLIATLAAAGAVVVSSVALAAGLGLVKFSWIKVGGKGGLEVASLPTVPAAVRGVPMATVDSNDPNLLVCSGGGWLDRSSPSSRLSTSPNVAAIPQQGHSANGLAPPRSVVTRGPGARGGTGI